MSRCGHRVALLALMLSVIAQTAFAASIRLRVDRNPVALNESFQMVFEADGSVDGDPDFAPLEQNFDILSTSQSSRISIINGKSTSTKTWTLTALARNTGRLEVPAIKFGADQSPPGLIEVTAAAATRPGPQAAESNEVFLEVEAQPLQPYVQQQIVYKVRLFRAAPTSNASLSDPQVEQGNAIIERIGEDASYETRVNGRPYQVVERRYAIFPQSSGPLKIDALTFRGQSGLSPFSMLDPFGRQPQMIVRQSAPVELEVRAKPEGQDLALWLPASSLTLTQSWSNDGPEFRVGVPITRTMTLSAEGLTASQLPELPAWVPGTFKSYPDQPQLTDGKSAEGLAGTRVEKVAIIPNQPGEFELPAIRIPWWNTMSDQLEVAEVPAQRIVVLPAVDAQALVPAPSVPVAGSDSASGDIIAPTTAVATGAQSGSRLWQWISAGLAMLWIATLVAWWYSRRPPPAQIDPAAQNARKLRRELEQACGRNNAAVAKESLLRWAQLRWPRNTPRNLGDVAARAGSGLAECLRILDANLYGRQSDAWNGAALWQAFVSEEKTPQPRHEEADSQLEPLHKI